LNSDIHPLGNYRFLRGIAPYSCGVVSLPGYEIIHVTFQEPPAYREGFERIAEFLQSRNRPKSSLCSISLRCPQPYTFLGFKQFNDEYAAILNDWKVHVDGVNPVARTNVAPEFAAPSAPVLYGFAFSSPCVENLKPTFVVAGAGELPEGILDRNSIVALGDTSANGIATKASFVMKLMSSRLEGLGVTWELASRINVYTVHSISALLPSTILSPIGRTAIHGVQWHFSRPPVEEIEYEMDVRGVRNELVL
jgi:hypothetical protein